MKFDSKKNFDRIPLPKHMINLKLIIFSGNTHFYRQDRCRTGELFDSCYKHTTLTWPKSSKGVNQEVTKGLSHGISHTWGIVIPTRFSRESSIVFPSPDRNPGTSGSIMLHTIACDCAHMAKLNSTGNSSVKTMS